MKRPRQVLERISEKVDLPRTIVAGLPQIEVRGYSEVLVDLQQGLVAYSNTEIIVAVSLGQVVIKGNRLTIRLMKESRIVVAGDIESLTLVRGNEP